MDEKVMPTFQKPDEQEQRAADPYADQAAYFAYWEAKRQQRRREEMEEDRSLSIYERAWKRRY